MERSPTPEDRSQFDGALAEMLTALAVPTMLGAVASAVYLMVWVLVKCLQPELHIPLATGPLIRDFAILAFSGFGFATTVLITQARYLMNGAVSKRKSD